MFGGASDVREVVREHYLTPIHQSWIGVQLISRASLGAFARAGCRGGKEPECGRARRLCTGLLGQASNHQRVTWESSRDRSKLWKTWKLWKQRNEACWKMSSTCESQHKLYRSDLRE